MAPLKIKKPVLALAIVIICGLVYVFIFHVPRPVMESTDTILSAGGGTYTSVNEETNDQESYDYGVGEIFVIGENSGVYAVIDVDELSRILNNTFSVTYKYDNAIDMNDVIYEINILTNNGKMHIIIGKENTFWYRTPEDTFKNRILNSDELYQRISDSLKTY